MDSHTQARRLAAVKLLHTAAWAFFVACIAAIPVAAAGGRLRVALILSAIVLLECLVVLLNGWRCPLTGVAARYTEERADNFDIYLPLWLARHNKTIFGALYLLGELYLLLQWLRSKA